MIERQIKNIIFTPTTSDEFEEMNEAAYFCQTLWGIQEMIRKGKLFIYDSKRKTLVDVISADEIGMNAIQITMKPELEIDTLEFPF